MRCGTLMAGAALLCATMTFAGDTGSGRRSALGAAPARAHPVTNPYAGNTEALRAGRKLFVRHCAECHGQGGLGAGRAPGLSSPSARLASPGDLFWFLTNGDRSAGMPSWSRLPDARRWQIVTFVKSLDAAPSSQP